MTDTRIILAYKNPMITQSNDSMNNEKDPLPLNYIDTQLQS